MLVNICGHNVIGARTLKDDDIVSIWTHTGVTIRLMRPTTNDQNETEMNTRNRKSTDESNFDEQQQQMSI